MTWASLELLETHLASDATVNSEFGSGQWKGQDMLEQNQICWWAPLYDRSHFSALHTQNPSTPTFGVKSISRLMRVSACCSPTVVKVGLFASILVQIKPIWQPRKLNAIWSAFVCLVLGELNCTVCLGGDSWRLNWITSGHLKWHQTSILGKLNTLFVCVSSKPVFLCSTYREPFYIFGISLNPISSCTSTRSELFNAENHG